MVLGHLEPQGPLYGGEQGYSVAVDRRRSKTQLRAAVGRLPELRPRSAAAIAQARRPRPSRRRRLSGTSPRAASSSATTGSSARSSTARPCPSPTAARSLKADGTMTGKRLAALIGSATSPAASSSRRTRAGPRPTATRPAGSLNRAYDRLRPAVRADQQDDLRRDRRRARVIRGCRTS